LAIPQWPEGEKQAVRFQSLGELLASDPLTLEIKEGVIEHFWSKNKLSSELFGDLFTKNKYQSVTEVGISFNRACSEFIHDWPAASNEGRPGVHIGIGGDPDPETDGGDDRTLVHVDLMAANCSVTVNGLPFLKTGI
jgi:hypothetical protein